MRFRAATPRTSSASIEVALLSGPRNGSAPTEGRGCPNKIESSSSSSSWRLELLRHAYQPPTSRATPTTLPTDARAATAPLLSPDEDSPSLLWSGGVSVLNSAGTKTVVVLPCSSVVVTRTEEGVGSLPPGSVLLGLGDGDAGVFVSGLGGVVVWCGGVD